MGQQNTSLDAAKCCVGVGEAKIPLDLVGNQSWEEPHGRDRCLACPRETRELRLSILCGGREGVAPISHRTHVEEKTTPTHEPASSIGLAQMALGRAATGLLRNNEDVRPPPEPVAASRPRHMRRCPPRGSVERECSPAAVLGARTCDPQTQRHPVPCSREGAWTLAAGVAVCPRSARPGILPPVSSGSPSQLTCGAWGANLIPVRPIPNAIREHGHEERPRRREKGNPRSCAPATPPSGGRGLPSHGWWTHASCISQLLRPLASRHPRRDGSLRSNKMPRFTAEQEFI